MGFFDKVKDVLTGSDDDEHAEEGYVELDTEAEKGSSKVIVRPFVLNDFDGIKPILDCLREGKTICLINMRPLKDKDLIELKRAINKLKKTADAISGQVAGFGEDFIVATPSFAEIHRSKITSKIPEAEEDDEMEKY